MQHALYHPETGYYRQTKQRTGIAGDFITSTSAGTLLGELLAQRLQLLWQSLGCPHSIAWIEQGAENGNLSADVLQTVTQRWPKLATALTPWFVEPWQPNQQQQKSTLPQSWQNKARWVDRIEDLPLLHGFFFANELLDAFPVQVFQQSNSGWQELGVEQIAQKRQFKALHPATKTLPPRLATALQTTETDSLPAPWIWEHQPDITPWLNALNSRLQSGIILLLDYGHTDQELLNPNRKEGSLRAYKNHRMLDPLHLPAGEADLTTHIHWDHLRQLGNQLGFQETSFQEQGRYLTHLAKPVLEEYEKNHTIPPAKWIRQLQQLIHPAHLGAPFQALEWKVEREP